MDDEDKMGKSLVKNSIYNIVYKLITALYPLVAVTYVSHILLAEKMGMVSYAQNIVSYFVVIAALGIPTYGIKEIAIKSEDIQARSQVFWELLTINTISTTLALAAYGMLILSVNKFYSNYLLYAVAGLQIAFNYINVDWFYQGMEEYKYISIRSIVVKAIALIALPVAIRTQEDYIWYALIYCMAIAGNNIFNIIRIRRYVVRPSLKLNLCKHLKIISVLLMVSIAVEIYAMIDTTMLGVFCNSSTVGCYSNAMKLTRMVNTMAAAIGTVLFPRLSVIFNNKENEEFNNLVNNGIKIMLMIAIPASLGMILCSKNIILLLFGNSFTDAIPILKILALMIPIVVCNTLMGGQVLVTTNQENKYVISVTTASIVNVILNGLLIPRFGATSAAVASLISEAIDLTLYCWFARKYVKLCFSRRYIVSIAVPLIIYSCISVFVIPAFHLNQLIELCINIIVCAFIYFGLGLLLKNEAMLFSLRKFRRIMHIEG